MASFEFQQLQQRQYSLPSFIDDKIPMEVICCGTGTTTKGSSTSSTQRRENLITATTTKEDIGLDDATYRHNWNKNDLNDNNDDDEISSLGLHSLTSSSFRTSSNSNSNSNSSSHDKSNSNNSRRWGHMNGQNIQNQIMYGDDDANMDRFLQQQQQQQEEEANGLQQQQHEEEMNRPQGFMVPVSFINNNRRSRRRDFVLTHDNHWTTSRTEVVEPQSQQVQQQQQLHSHVPSSSSYYQQSVDGHIQTIYDSLLIELNEEDEEQHNQEQNEKNATVLIEGENGTHGYSLSQITDCLPQQHNKVEEKDNHGMKAEILNGLVSTTNSHVDDPKKEENEERFDPFQLHGYNATASNINTNGIMKPMNNWMNGHDDSEDSEEEPYPYDEVSNDHIFVRNDNDNDDDNNNNNHDDFAFDRLVVLGPIESSSTTSCDSDDHGCMNDDFDPIDFEYSCYHDDNSDASNEQITKHRVSRSLSGFHNRTRKSIFRRINIFRRPQPQKGSHNAHSSALPSSSSKTTSSLIGNLTSPKVLCNKHHHVESVTPSSIHPVRTLETCTTEDDSYLVGEGPVSPVQHTSTKSSFAFVDKLRWSNRSLPTGGFASTTSSFHRYRNEATKLTTTTTTTSSNKRSVKGQCYSNDNNYRSDIDNHQWLYSRAMIHIPSSGLDERDNWKGFNGIFRCDSPSFVLYPSTYNMG